MGAAAASVRKMRNVPMAKRPDKLRDKLLAPPDPYPRIRCV